MGQRQFLKSHRLSMQGVFLLGLGMIATWIPLQAMLPHSPKPLAQDCKKAYQDLKQQAALPHHSTPSLGLWIEKFPGISDEEEAQLSLMIKNFQIPAQLSKKNHLTESSCEIEPFFKLSIELLNKNKSALEKPQALPKAYLRLLQTQFQRAQPFGHLVVYFEIMENIVQSELVSWSMREEKQWAQIQGQLKILKMAHQEHDQRMKKEKIALTQMEDFLFAELIGINALKEQALTLLSGAHAS